ncbi:MAG: response regulator [Bdellovibrionales bacterium]|nr:response regulator [Bdellovibrionales bacterium]
MRVLIVEDDPTTAQMMKFMIRNYVEYSHAGNGQEGYDAFCTALDEKKPFDLVFLDIMMPMVDGQEMLEAIRVYEEDCGISCSEGAKVVMTTCVDDTKEIYHSLSHGVLEYLTKPVDRKKLLSIMEIVNGSPLTKQDEPYEEGVFS